MKRFKLQEYSTYPHKTEIKVLVTDINFRNHMGYDTVVTKTQHVRGTILEELGVSETDLGDGVAGASVPDYQMTIMGEAHMGDVLTFETRVTDIGSSFFRLAHRVKNQDGVPIALIEITIVSVDYEKRKAVPLPQILRNGLNSLRG